MAERQTSWSAAAATIVALRFVRRNMQLMAAVARACR